MKDDKKDKEGLCIEVKVITIQLDEAIAKAEKLKQLLLEINSISPPVK